MFSPLLLTHTHTHTHSLTHTRTHTLAHTQKTHTHTHTITHTHTLTRTHTHTHIMCAFFGCFVWHWCSAIEPIVEATTYMNADIDCFDNVTQIMCVCSQCDVITSDVWYTILIGLKFHIYGHSNNTWHSRGSSKCHMNFFPI
jgi:hypothetical protein